MAIDEELQKLDLMGVWELGNLPEGKVPLECRWVFALKKAFGTDDTIYKARCMAKGYKQVAGVDFVETFAPTATFASLRLLLTMASRFQ